MGRGGRASKPFDAVEMNPYYLKGTDYEQVTAYMAALQEADFLFWFDPPQRIHPHRFPVGYFPSLYREHDDRPAARYPHEGTLVQELVGGVRRSRFFYPLRRAGWIRAARRKVNQSTFLVGLATWSFQKGT